MTQPIQLPDLFSTCIGAAMLHINGALHAHRNDLPAFVEYRLRRAREEIEYALECLPESDRKKARGVLALLEMPIPTAGSKRMATHSN